MRIYSQSTCQILVATLMLSLSVVMFAGCESTKYWWNNNRMVGPNYATPAAPTAAAFTQQETGKVDGSSVQNPEWWRIFNDPNLDQIIDGIRSQNLSLKAALYRIEEARRIRAIAAANLFPQSQTVSGAYAHTQISQEAATAIPGGPVSIDDWSVGFNAGWELDLWGRIRRSIRAADAGVDAAIHDRNFAMVSLIGDAAELYILIRSFEERIELAKKNVKLQEGSRDIAKIRFDEGRTSKLDLVQAESNLAATRSLIPQLELGRRQSLNALAVLLGIPPAEITSLSEQPGVIPFAPPQVIVGIPAELVCRRPDIRAAERNMAAQFEQIGITEADLYPTFTVSGTLGWQAARMSDLLESSSFNGTISPGFQWNVLNYGRIKNAIGAEEALFKQVQFDFENTVLNAQREVEDGIVEFIKRNEQYEFDLANVEAAEESVELAIAAFKEGKTDFGRVFVIQTSLVTSQDQLVDTRARIATALVTTYRALGGGWETCPPPALQVTKEERFLPWRFRR